MKETRFAGIAIGSDGYVVPLVFNGSGAEGELFWVDDIGVNIVSGVTNVITEDLQAADRAVTEETITKLLTEDCSTFAVLLNVDEKDVVAVWDENSSKFKFYDDKSNEVELDILQGEYCVDILDECDDEYSDYVSVSNLY